MHNNGKARIRVQNLEHWRFVATFAENRRHTYDENTATAVVTRYVPMLDKFYQDFKERL